MWDPQGHTEEGCTEPPRASLFLGAGIGAVIRLQVQAQSFVLGLVWTWENNSFCLLQCILLSCCSIEGSGALVVGAHLELKWSIMVCELSLHM